MIQKTIKLCREAAELNYSNKFRKGNIVYLPDDGKVIVAGDIHGHRRNFERIVAFADLENDSETHVVFQEIIHGGTEDDYGGCLSFHLLFDAVALQLQFPERVHLILGNHDTAVITDQDVLKGGREMNRIMNAAMKRCFGSDYNSVRDALAHYLLSQPLAIKCANRIWLSHSLPSDRFVDDFDAEVFHKKLQPDDLLRQESAYLLTWGRDHSDQALKKLAELLDVDIFILGHQSQDTGWRQAGKNLIILSSEHNHGCLIAFDAARSYTIAELEELIVPLASIA